MNATYTPGPWFQDTSDWPIQIHSVEMTRNWIIAKVPADRMHDDPTGECYYACEESRFNAKLIAASPSMFDALKTLVAVATSLHAPSIMGAVDKAVAVLKEIEQ